MPTVTGAAHILGAHINSVRRWPDRGLLPSYRIGLRGDRRFGPDEVSSFLVSPKRGKSPRSGPLCRLLTAPTLSRGATPAPAELA